MTRQRRHQVKFRIEHARGQDAAKVGIPGRVLDQERHAAFGSVQTSLVRAEYTYAQVDKDATLAAYATDDFFWSTGWKGHRVDLGSRITDKSSFHAVGQLQKFEDSPRVEERDHWVKRLRLEMRFSY
jgi:hypothetical protein